jgi:Protein of unknown function (DUF3421)
MSKRYFWIISILFIAPGAYAQNTTVSSKPPFHGTIFLDPDIITHDDPTTFLAVTPGGQASRKMFDRRVNDWITVNAFLFYAAFTDGLSTEVQVNPEFGNIILARAEAEKYAWVIGQLPTCLRQEVQTVWIHKGVQLYGGGNNNILIHTGQTELYEKEGILEEALVHEATHTSLDAKHALSVDWLRAAQFDRTFISTYAEENPKREDVSETFLLYMAVTLRADRISDDLKQTIQNTIPNRLFYLESLDLNFYPLVPAEEKEVPVEVVVETEVQPTEQPEPARLEWIAFDGMVPENSVSGGKEKGNDLPICRGSYNGAVHPGKLLANKCNIGWGGKEIELSSFDVLVNSGVPLVWVDYKGSIPVNAVEAGNENGKILYVGQFTRPDGSTHPGKVFGKSGNYIFNYSYGGKEIVVKGGFRILSK